jgi:hypothetical protein
MNFVLQPWQLLLASRAVDVPPGRRIAPSLRPRRVGSLPYITTGPCCVDPAARRGFRDPQGEKTPPLLPFITPKKSTQRPRVCRRGAPSIDERFCRRIRPGDDVFGTHKSLLVGFRSGQFAAKQGVKGIVRVHDNLRIKYRASRRPEVQTARRQSSSKLRWTTPMVRRQYPNRSLLVRGYTLP